MPVGKGLRMFVIRPISVERRLLLIRIGPFITLALRAPRRVKS
jgi:hypothetical protein